MKTWAICSKLQLLGDDYIWYEGGMFNWVKDRTQAFVFDDWDHARWVRDRINAMEDAEDPDGCADLRWWLVRLT